MSYTLIAMMGLPRSGKSTVAQKIGFPIVNPDSIRLALHGNAFISASEGFVWATAMLMVRYFFLQGHENVIFDATNTTYQRRDNLKSKEWNVVFLEMTTDKGECIQRAIDGQREDLLPVIERMNVQYEPLRHDESHYRVVE